MAQILDYFIEPAYGQICLSDQDAELSWQSTFNEQQVAFDETSITIAVTDEEPEHQVEVEVYLGHDEKPSLRYLSESLMESSTSLELDCSSLPPLGMKFSLRKFRMGHIRTQSTVTVIQRRGW